MNRRRHRTIRQTAALSLALSMVGATPALALDEAPTPADLWRTIDLGETTRRPAVDALGAGPRAPTAIGRLREKLLRIPLRPVRIGTTPRRPDDPDPGMGLVVRLRF